MLCDLSLNRVSASCIRAAPSPSYGAERPLGSFQQVGLLRKE